MNKMIIYYFLIVGTLLFSGCNYGNVNCLDDIEQLPQKTSWVRILSGVTDDDVLALKRVKGIRLLVIYNSIFTDNAYKNLASIASELPHWDGLQIVCTGSNITDDTMMYISQITQLKSLSLYNCSGFTDKGYKYLAESKSIDEICIVKQEQFSDDSVAIIATMPQLKSLKFIECVNITDKALENIAQSKGIECLELIGCSGITNTGFRKLKASESISRLYFSEYANFVEGKEAMKFQPYDNIALGDILAMPNLKELVIGMDNLNNDSLSLIAESGLGKIVFINEIPFDQNSLKILSQSQSLEYLDFYFNESVSIETLRALPELKSLRRLYIHGLPKEGLKLLKEISAQMPLCVINDWKNWTGSGL